MKKCVTIYGNISISGEILEAIKEAGLSDYTRWPRIVGVGHTTGPRLDSHVWPGANTGVQVVAEEDAANRLMDRLQALRDSEAGRQAGLFAFLSPVERTL